MRFAARKFLSIFARKKIVAYSAACIAPVALMLLQPLNAHAQGAALTPPANAPAWFLSTWQQALSSPLPAGISALEGALEGIGPVIPQTEFTLDATGFLGTYQPGGPTTTATNAFFQSLGTNGRSCATCHQPASSMSISKAQIELTYLLTGGKDPLFAPVDGANCPNQVPAVNTAPSPLGGFLGQGKNLAAAHSLLLNRGVFRIFLPVPANAEFTVTVVSDPTTCNTTPAYNQVVNPTTGAVTQIVSVFRRPRIASNLAFVTGPLGFGPPSTCDPTTDAAGTTSTCTGKGNIMWDGREPSLLSQATDATLGHAQASAPPTTAQLVEMVNFEVGLYSAQSYDFFAGNLAAPGLMGGPVNLGTPAIEPPGSTLFVTHIPPFEGFYDAWSTVTGTSPQAQMQASILRGENIFNNFTFTVNDVHGISDLCFGGHCLGGPGSTCGLCHNQQYNGNDDAGGAQHEIGVGGQDNGNPSLFNSAPAPATDLPIFLLTCNPGTTPSYVGSVVYTNDPGAALITGKCADIGSSTVPQLRGLASHAPYFRDGSAQTLLAVVNFYNNRFNMGLSAQQKTDLVNFLNTL
jgi:cytochrome c peroxidase